MTPEPFEASRVAAFKKPLQDDRVAWGRRGSGSGRIVCLSGGARPGFFRVRNGPVERRAQPRSVLLGARVRAPSMAARPTKGVPGLRHQHRPPGGTPRIVEGYGSQVTPAASSRKCFCGKKRR